MNNNIKFPDACIEEIIENLRKFNNDGWFVTKCIEHSYLQYINFNKAYIIQSNLINIY